MHTYRLDVDAKVYEPSGSFTDVIDTDGPWRLEIPVAALRPRNF